jgi:hypothetical protein
MNELQFVTGLESPDEAPSLLRDEQVLSKAARAKQFAD